MPEFRYKGINIAGKPIQGIVFSPDMKTPGVVFLSAKSQMPHFRQKVRREESPAEVRDSSHGNGGHKNNIWDFVLRKTGNLQFSVKH